MPPLNAVRTFEVAARCLSFKQAARELHVTPAAVSQQIRLLEDWLGMPLFQRAPRKLGLTGAGQTYLRQVQDGLGRICEATARLLASEQGNTLSVGAMASFATKWLVPRLGRFCERHPGIGVNLSTANNLVDSELEDASERLVDFDQRNAEVTIRYGRGNWAGLLADKLCSDRVFPVCSPRWIQEHGELRAAEDLRQMRLLHDVLPEGWGAWLETAGVTGFDGSSGPVFSHSHDMLMAAICGLGVALGRSFLVADDLRAGRLVQPFEITIRSSFSYYFVCPDTMADRDKVVAFRSWLTAEIASESDTLDAFEAQDSHGSP